MKDVFLNEVIERCIYILCIKKASTTQHMTALISEQYERIGRIIYDGIEFAGKDGECTECRYDALTLVRCYDCHFTHYRPILRKMIESGDECSCERCPIFYYNKLRRAGPAVSVGGIVSDWTEEKRIDRALHDHFYKDYKP